MDLFLSLGYYRMRQTLFTTAYTLTDDNRPVPVLWARICLENYRTGRRFKELQRRNRHFSIALQKAAVTDETEELYTRYAASVRFDAPGSVREFLLGEEPVDYFPGLMWQVRDQGRLIAAGYFDEGTDSAAGILNFYDPVYNRHSLSKWMYLKTVHDMAVSGKKYFYPGYVALGYAKFDYKLEAGLAYAEIWSPEQGVWLPYEESLHARQATTV